jgi:hypothetical protein
MKTSIGWWACQRRTRFCHVIVALLLSLLCGVPFYPACGRRPNANAVVMPKNTDLFNVDGDVWKGSPDLTEGRRILLQARDAMRAINNASMIIRLSATFSSPTKTWGEQREFTVKFGEPGQFRMDFSDSNGDPVVIIANKDDVWTTFPSGNARTWRRRQRLTDVLSELGGVSLTGTAVFPPFVLGSDGFVDAGTPLKPSGDVLLKLASKAEIGLENETVNGRKCWRIDCVREPETWAIYVDADNYLIRRVDITANERQVEKQRDFGGGGTSGQIRGYHVRQVIEFDGADAVSGETFVPPSD